MNILITGGASGLGLALARKLAAEKEHNIFITYFRSKEQALLLAQECSNVTPIYCDFGNLPDLERVQGEMEKMNLDVLINNAITGIDIARFHEIPPEHFLEYFQKNIFPVILFTQKAITIFRSRDKGKIVTILTSYLSEKAPLGLSEYVASKAYLASLCKSWATENERFNITSNAVSPTFMLTPLTRNIDARIVRSLAENALDPEHVASAVAHLLLETPEVNGMEFVITKEKTFSREL